MTSFIPFDEFVPVESDFLTENKKDVRNQNERMELLYGISEKFKVPVDKVLLVFKHDNEYCFVSQWNENLKYTLRDAKIPYVAKALWKVDVTQMSDEKKEFFTLHLPNSNVYLLADMNTGNIFKSSFLPAPETQNFRLEKRVKIPKSKLIELIQAATSMPLYECTTIAYYDGDQKWVTLPFNIDFDLYFYVTTVMLRVERKGKPSVYFEVDSTPSVIDLMVLPYKDNFYNNMLRDYRKRVLGGFIMTAEFDVGL